jgi:hypothetical protein
MMNEISLWVGVERFPMAVIYKRFTNGHLKLLRVQDKKI